MNTRIPAIPPGKDTGSILPVRSMFYRVDCPITVFKFKVCNICDKFKGDKMTKDEAMQAMREGKKVTHTWFSRNEWVTRDGKGFVFEDGCRCSPANFFEDRTCESWNTGWSIFNE